MGALLSMRLPEELEQRLDEEATRQGCKRSRLVRMAIEQFVERLERERRLSMMAREMRVAYGSEAFRREALQSTEDAIDDGLTASDPSDTSTWWM